ncbi:hypothetical protein ACU4GH_39470 [Bradyrhizobium betae]
MSLNQDGKAVDARRCGQKRIAGHHAGAYNLEHLRGFQGLQASQFGLEPLNGELGTKQLLHHAGQMAQGRRGPEIILPVLRDEEVGPEILACQGRADLSPGADLR